MRTPTKNDRERLDKAIATLSRQGEDVTLDDFRTATIAAAQRTNHRIRLIAFYGSLIFIGLVLAVYSTLIPDNSGTVLGFAMGGLGAATSLFVLILRLNPEEPFKVTDEFDALGRIILGCVFSIVLSKAIPVNPVSGKPGATLALALAPFLFGYSTELALRVLDRAVQTIIGFFGGDDRRTSAPARRSTRRRARKGQ